MKLQWDRTGCDLSSFLLVASNEKGTEQTIETARFTMSFGVLGPGKLGNEGKQNEMDTPDSYRDYSRNPWTAQ